MTRTATLDPVELPGLEQIARAWPQERWGVLRPLTAGRTNESFHVASDNGEFVLRRLWEGKTIPSLQFELALIHRLAAHGVPVAETLPTAERAPWAEAGGRLWTLSRFVPTDAEPPKLQAARLAGEVLARFHDAVAGWGLDIASPEQDRTALALAALDAIDANAVPQELTSVPERCRRILEALRVALPVLRAPLPTIVIHGACRTSSVLYRQGKVAALLDMDSSRLGPVPEDLAIAVASFAKCRGGDAAVRADAAAALFAGYRSRRGIADGELAALPAYLAQALTYPLVKALGRVVQGRNSVADFERGAWRLAAAEYALERPAALIELLGKT